MMLDPEKNINIGDWDREDLMREKVDIHRARLNKFGRSKMNGQMIFKEKKEKSSN